MQKYLVGGAVRDLLLGREASDKDYVVVGATTQQMLDAGFKQVGKDFPVFIQENGGDEYALARTERSTGNGYKDFTFRTEGVTLEDDLRRRDLTINAIAMNEEGNFIDPFGGRNDLTNHVLRHIDDEAFKEDPLRVLRLARFCAKFPSFNVDHATRKLCQQMVRDGMLAELTAERVANEMLKAFTCKQPTRFFYFLQMVGALEVVFPEVHRLVGVPAGSFTHHPEGDTFTHTMMVMEQVQQLPIFAQFRDPTLILFAALVHDFGKGTTPIELLPKHHGHEQRSVVETHKICDRLKLSNELREFGVAVARYHHHVHNVFKLNPKTIVKLADELKFRHTNEFARVLVAVAAADARGRSSFYQRCSYSNSEHLYALLIVTNIGARDVCDDKQIKNANIVRDRLFKARVTKVKEVMEYMNG